MTREIKFRAFNPEDKSIFGDKMVKKFGFEMKKWIYMQFTGLKDRNGKEIYEGDIVKGIWGKTNINIFKIVWSNKYASFDGEDKEGERYVFGDYDENLEVIGNIYENPELLNKDSTKK